MSATRNPLPPAPDGLPVYRWDEVPDGLFHRTALSELGRKPASGQLPLGYLRYHGNKKTPLFAKADTVPKAVFSPEHRDKLRMAAAARYTCPGCGTDLRDSPTPPWGASNRCGGCAYQEIDLKIARDRVEAIGWAKEMLSRSRDDIAIADTETAWLHGPVCELALTDVEGRVLFHSVINPLARITPEAEAIHGISNEEASRAPTMHAVFDRLSAAIEGRHVLFWNAAYDEPVLEREAFRVFGLPMWAHKSWATAKGGETAKRFHAARAWMETWTRECLMEWHAQYYGAFDPQEWEYRWQKLGGNHRAMGDCLTAADRLAEMGGVERMTQLEFPLLDALAC